MRTKPVMGVSERGMFFWHILETIFFKHFDMPILELNLNRLKQHSCSTYRVADVPFLPKMVNEPKEHCTKYGYVNEI